MSEPPGAETARNVVRAAALILIGSLALFWLMGLFVPKESAGRFLHLSLTCLCLEFAAVVLTWRRYLAVVRRADEEAEYLARRIREGEAQAARAEAERRQREEQARREAAAAAARQAEAERQAREYRERVRAEQAAEAQRRRAAAEAQRAREASEREADQRRQARDREMAASVLARLRDGHLPTVQPPALLHVGEKCLHVAPAELHLGRFDVPPGPGRPDAAPQFLGEGLLAVTTSRLLFRARGKDGRELSVGIRNIVALGTEGTDGLTVQSSAHPDYYVFRTAYPGQLAAYLFCMFYREKITPRVDRSLGTMIGAG